MSLRHSAVNFIARQYNEKWRFPDYDRAIKKLQCHHIHSFLSCNPQIFEGVTYDYDVPVYICKFSPLKLNSNVLIVANENGTVCVEDISKNSSKTYVQTHNNTVFDVAWMPGEKKFVTVSGDHSAKLWDCGESDIKMVSEFLGHSRSVKCVYFKPENTSVFATGSRDGSLILWDARCSRRCSKFPVSHIPDQIIPSAAGTSPYVPKRKYYPVEASKSNSVTGLVFQNDSTLISCGSSDQFIRVWDMRKTYSRSHSLPVPKYQLFAPSAGFSHLCIDPAGTKLYANNMDSYIYCFDVNSYIPDPISAFYGHQNGSFYVKSSISHDGLYLLSGSTEKCGYIWNTKNAELSDVAVRPLVALPGHTAEVACVVMSLSGDTKVATCSDDGTYRLWYTYELENTGDSTDVFEASDDVNRDYTTLVRTEWKNKRKYSEVDRPFSTNGRCAFHYKICRYYSNNLAAATCTCNAYPNNLSKGIKRHLNEADSVNLRLAKRFADWELTPPKLNEVKTENETITHSPKSSKPPNVAVKISLKRKLSELSNFVDDSDPKRKPHEWGYRDAIYPARDNESKPESQSFGDACGVQYESLFNKQFSSNKESKDHRNFEDLSQVLEFPSPTTNLPNYVKDGTSPYLHRCPKTQKENLDWLTKLKKNNSKGIGIDLSENKGGTPKICAQKGGGKSPIVCIKRKARSISMSSDSKKVNHTLHKYFKVSNRSTEINYISQDVQKKTC